MEQVEFKPSGAPAPDARMTRFEAKMYGTQTLMAVDSLKRVIARGQDDV